MVTNNSVGIVAFGAARLDIVAGTLERNSVVVPIRAKSFALLCFLARNPNRVISKDELIQEVWNRAAVTDDALTQTIKDVRKAIGDKESEIVQSVPKRGYRFVLTEMSRPNSGQIATDIATSLSTNATIKTSQQNDLANAGASDDGLILLVDESLSKSPLPASRYGQAGAMGTAEPAPPSHPNRSSGRSRPAIAILPFQISTPSPKSATVFCDGLLRDIIRDLSRQRTVSVIAANSAMLLACGNRDGAAVGRLLRVDYVCAGKVNLEADRIRLEIELTVVQDDRILWSESLGRSMAGTSAIGTELAAEVARAVTAEIELSERNLTATMPKVGLVAWQAYHRGLWHMYRSSADDIALASEFFDVSVELDPAFSRPYAGRSYTHWLKAFLTDYRDQGPESQLALDDAWRSVNADPNDPTAHCALGRALWINNATDDAIEALKHSITLSPNYAFAHYALGFTEGVSGDPAASIRNIDTARELSPFDTSLSAMHATRALALLRLGKFEESAAWGARAARHPNAHAQILRTAAICLTAGGYDAEAAPLVQTINSTSHESGGEGFLRTMRLNNDDRTHFQELMKKAGLR